MPYSVPLALRYSSPARATAVLASKNHVGFDFGRTSAVAAGDD